MKALAEKFRPVAEDKPAVALLVANTRAAYTKDEDVTKLCDDFESAVDGNAVRALIDQVVARTE